MTGRDPMASRSGPRNYLAPRERRRMFWLLMPPALVAVLALGWIERTWFPRREAAGVPQVDTRLAAARGAATAGEAVVIEPEPERFEPAGGELSASVESLAQIRDDSLFRRDEQPAWIETWLKLQATDPVALRRAARPVSFTEMFGQPLSFRGRAVRFKGTLRRLELLRTPANEHGITDYWQGWVEPAGGPPSPILVQFLRKPEGMPAGMKIAEPVEVAGYFFKRHAYQAVDTLRRAPLVLAIEPAWSPRTPAEPGGTSLGTVAVVTMAGVVAATALALFLGNRGRGAARPAPPTDLDEALSGVDAVSTGEALRRLAAEHAAAESPPPETDP